MSNISATLFPTISITNKSKWRIRQAATLSNSTNDTIVTKVQNRRLNNMTTITRSDLFSVNFTHKRKTHTSASHLHQTPNYETMDMSTAEPTETMSELERMRNGGYWFRKWDSLDVTRLLLISVRHGLAICAPFVFNWGAILVALVLWIFAGLGVTIGYHRLLTHRSFKIPKWLEYFFAYCGVHTGQVYSMNIYVYIDIPVSFNKLTPWIYTQLSLSGHEPIIFGVIGHHDTDRPPWYR